MILTAGGCSRRPESYILKGDKLFSQEKFDEAALNYGKAIAKDGSFGEAYYRLGLTDIRMGKAAEVIALCMVEPGQRIRTRIATQAIPVKRVATSVPKWRLTCQAFRMATARVVAGPNGIQGWGALVLTFNKPIDGASFFFAPACAFATQGALNAPAGMESSTIQLKPEITNFAKQVSKVRISLRHSVSSS